MPPIVIQRSAFLATMLLSLASLAGCETAGQGAVSGGAIGALSGLAIGSMTGSAGKGAAIGAITGVVGGAIIGDQNRRKHEQAMATSPPPPTPPAVPPANYEAVAALERFVGVWKVEGWAQLPGRERMKLTGEATGVTEKNFFVRVEIKLNDPGGGEAVEGTSVFSQNGGRKITLVNSFSTSPETKRFEGELDASGSIFTLSQVSPKADRRVVIRQSGATTWVAEAWESGPGGDVRTESLTFTPG